MDEHEEEFVEETYSDEETNIEDGQLSPEEDAFMQGYDEALDEKEKEEEDDE
jgi:hypothetical protein